MKKKIKIAALALIAVIGSSILNNTSAQYGQRSDVSYQTFYDKLSPYGQWIDYPEYGYVWVPDAGDDFQPYQTNGHWVWTDDYEWMWVSDYEWGWAPFHYGRWFEDDYYGWMWQPDYEWSPAWVAWRDGGDYYGWAPLRPGISISVNFNIGSYDPPYNYWSFAPRRYITSPRIFDYCYDRRQNNIYINQTTIINNYNYNRNVFRTGPRRVDVEIYTGRINPVRFRDSYSPGRTFYRNNEVNVYRPNIRRDENRQYTPRQFNRYERENNNDNNRRGRNRNEIRQDNNSSNRSNNIPQRRFDRRDNTVREQQNGNRNQDRRNSNDIINNRQQESTPDNGNNQRRRIFERRNDNNSGNNDERNRRKQERNADRQDRQQPPTRQIQQEREPQPRQFDRRSRDENAGRQPGERNNRQERPQVQPIEQRRQERPQVQPMDQRNQQRPQQQRVEQSGRSDQPPRQVERRDTNRPATDINRRNDGNQRNGRRF